MMKTITPEDRDVWWKLRKRMTGATLGTMTITQAVPMIFSRLQEERQREEIRKAMMETWAYWCATGLLVIAGLVLAWRVWL